MQVSRSVEGLTETRLTVSYLTDPIAVRWLAPDRFAFTMPHDERVRPDGHVDVSVQFNRTFAPHVSHRDGPRSCTFFGSFERRIYESPSVMSVPLRGR